MNPETLSSMKLSEIKSFAISRNIQPQGDRRKRSTWLIALEKRRVENSQLADRHMAKLLSDCPNNIFRNLDLIPPYKKPFYSVHRSF